MSRYINFYTKNELIERGWTKQLIQSIERTERGYKLCDVQRIEAENRYVIEDQLIAKNLRQKKSAEVKKIKELPEFAESKQLGDEIEKMRNNLNQLVDKLGFDPEHIRYKIEELERDIKYKKNQLEEHLNEIKQIDDLMTELKQTEKQRIEIDDYLSQIKDKKLEKLEEIEKLKKCLKNWINDFNDAVTRNQNNYYLGVSIDNKIIDYYEIIKDVVIEICVINPDFNYLQYTKKMMKYTFHTSVEKHQILLEEAERIQQINDSFVS